MMKFSFFFLFTIFSSSAFAFPEMVRHGYANCTSCHLSPAGGGALTLYGRELSKEILSMTSAKNEQYFAYNAIPSLSQSEKILVAAYIRGLQVLRDNKSYSDARTILMQYDFEAAYNAKDWAVLGTIGRQEIRKGQESAGRFFSRRHYLLGRIDKNQNIRAGKFLKSFGLNDPNHYLFVRSGLNFSYDTESYNLEYSFLNEEWNFFATYVTNWKTDDYMRSNESGVALNSSLTLYKKSKLGLSYFHGASILQKRDVVGLWAITSFTKQFYLMSEFDWQFQKIKSSNKKINGPVMSHRLSYEVTKGLEPYISYDQKYLDLKNKQTELHSFGAGVRFFPRPHFEFTGAVQREIRVSSNQKDYLYWLMGQFYL